MAVKYEWRKGARGTMLEGKGSGLNTLVVVSSDGAELRDLYRSGSLYGEALEDAREAFGPIGKLAGAEEKDTGKASA